MTKHSGLHFEFYSFANFCVSLAAFYISSSYFFTFDNTFVSEPTLGSAILFLLCAFCASILLVARVLRLEILKHTSMMDAAPILIFFLALYFAGSFQPWMIILVVALALYAVIGYIDDKPINGA